jgi:ABC-type antimicrobial peptide transport system permease subunit
MRYSKKLKQGQATIFVIFGIVLIVGILAFIYLRGDIDLRKFSERNPRQFLQDCVKDSVEESLFTVLANGGEIDMSHYISYFGEGYNYLCYSGGYFSRCYNIYPMLEYSIESEIKSGTNDAFQECFDSLKENLEKEGFSFSSETADYSINLLPGTIKVNLDKEITISREGTSQNFEDFDIEIISDIYGLVKVVGLIVNEETSTCDFDHYNYMIYDPKYSIEKNNFDDSKIYSVMNRRTREEFRFAVRNCVIPPGL